MFELSTVGNMIRNRILTALVLLFIAACERHEPLDLGSVDCAECYQVKPAWVPLNMEVTINDENQSVPVTIYFGNYEDGDEDTTVIAKESDYWIDVRPDRKYSVRARYIKGTDTIYVIDGDEVNLKYSETSCDVGCYYQSGGFVDVRLRP